MLYELLRQTEANIHCLVRRANVHEGQKRIETNRAPHIICPSIDAELFAGYFSYFIHTGFLDAPELNGKDPMWVSSLSIEGKP